MNIHIEFFYGSYNFNESLTVPLIKEKDSPIYNLTD